MAKVTLPISQGFYVSASLPISNQRCVNFRPNIPQADTVTQDNLFGTPGIRELLTLGPNIIGRGSNVMADIAYTVIGPNLYRINRQVIDDVDVFTTDDLGTIEGTDRVYMANNGTQLCIVAIPDSETAGKSYIFTESPDTLTEITDPNFDGPASSVEYISGYFSFTKSDGKKFFNSPLNDGLGAYDALDFSTAEADPDQIRAQIAYKNFLYILGSETTQPFRDIGRTPAPFSPTPTVIDVGIDAPQSLKLFGGGFAFVGSGKNESSAVWMIDGTGRRKISTIAIDNELSKLAADDLENVFAWTTGSNGAFFYGITFPKTCFVYDIANRRWHERQSNIIKAFEGQETEQYRVSTMMDAYDRVIVTDLQDGRIGELVEDEYLEYGRMITRFVTSKPFDNNGKPVLVNSIEAVVDSGVGLTNDINIETDNTSGGDPITSTGGSDPQITLSWSDDGGHIFKGGRSRSMGKIGEYQRRPIWNRMGRFARSRVLRFELSSPTKATIIKIEADIA